MRFDGTAQSLVLLIKCKSSRARTPFHPVRFDCGCSASLCFDPNYLPTYAGGR
jgi:hypothetical protein